MADDQEKTEDPTPKRREEARKKGQVARSQDANTAVLILAGITLVYAFGGSIMATFFSLMAWAFSSMHEVNLSPAGISALTVELGEKILVMVGPICVALMIAGLGVSILQTGWMVSLEPMIPNFTKLNPISGMKNLVSMQSLMKVIMSLVKLTIIIAVTYYAVIDDVSVLFGLSGHDIQSIFGIVSDITFWMVVKMALALLIFSILDWIYQKQRHEQQLKMSHQEIKEEMKQSEGDPQVKGKIKQKMMQANYQRMMQSVPDADVVVTNPTHVAVALKYDASIAEAPIVLAKGQRLIAQKIKQIAKENGIPVVEDKPLARALFENAEIGEEVPPALYRAVAKLLGYIYRMKKKTIRT